MHTVACKLCSAYTAYISTMVLASYGHSALRCMPGGARFLLLLCSLPCLGSGVCLEYGLASFGHWVTPRMGSGVFVFWALAHSSYAYTCVMMSSSFGKLPADRM